MIPSMHWDSFNFHLRSSHVTKQLLHSFSQSFMCCFLFILWYSKNVTEETILPINLISPTFSCTFSMLHLINLKFSQLISRPTSTPLLPFNTHSLHFYALPLFPIAHNLKSSCNIMHNSLTDVGRTDVISFCQGIHSFTMPSGFFFFCCV